MRAWNSASGQMTSEPGWRVAGTVARWWCSALSTRKTPGCARWSSCIRLAALPAELELNISAEEHAGVQLTTPGAGKWYRGFGHNARQTVRIGVAAGAMCEWLPQENIVFDGAAAQMSLQVDLAAIDGRGIGQFDFSGTGMDAANDADPADYEVNNGFINISNMVPGTPVKVRGFVTAFGHAPEVADFDAHTIINVADVTAVMVVGWFPASRGAAENLSPDSFRLNLQGTGWFHHLCRAGVGTDLHDLPNPPLIEANESGQGLYFIVAEGSSQLLFTFEDFVDELSEHLNENAAVRHIVAVGKFDDAVSAMTVNRVTVSLK